MLPYIQKWIHLLSDSKGLSPLISVSPCPSPISLLRLPKSLRRGGSVSHENHTVLRSDIRDMANCLATF